MSKSKISPRVREQAAIYCNMIVNWFHAPMGAPHPHPANGNVSKSAFHLACTVINDLASENLTSSEKWAEAEALLRTGWEP